jgi:aerobic-type carbon monoxide dehydrogenase small subunit (CoxS/CutS family)
MVCRTEKLAADPALHPVQQAMIDEQAVQCGYCFNGMIIKASELLSNPAALRSADTFRHEWASLPLWQLPSNS